MIRERIHSIIKAIIWILKSHNITNFPIKYNPHSILFICKGNIIRSIFAEHYLKKHMSQDAEIKILSAGIHAKTGTPSPEDAVKVAKEFDIHISCHRSNLISEDIMERSDMIICMEHWHMTALQKRFPESKRKLVLMSIFDPDYKNLPMYLKYNIPDPYGKPEKDFRETFNRIIRCIDQLRIKIDKNKV